MARNATSRCASGREVAPAGGVEGRASSSSVGGGKGASAMGSPSCGWGLSLSSASAFGHCFNQDLELISGN